MRKPVRKAVIPAAGFGTRFLPATKSQPKEMLPIVDKPTIQYIIEEAIASGIEEILIVTSTTKRSIEDHFDKSYELEDTLAKKGKTDKIPLSQSAQEVVLNITRTESIYVFPGKDGGQRKDYKRIAQRVRDNAGLPKTFRPIHGLRHTYASLLASSGKVDLYTLQKLLTHESPQMTQRYAHLADEALQRAARVSDSIFSVKENKDTE